MNQIGFNWLFVVSVTDTNIFSKVINNSNNMKEDKWLYPTYTEKAS